MWLFVGFIYLFAFLLIPSIDSGTFTAIYYISGIILSFYYRKKFLIRMRIDQERNITQLEYDNFREQIAKEFNEKRISENSNLNQLEDFEDAFQKEKLAIKNTNKRKKNKKHPMENSVPIDINSCNTKSLSELPGVTMILAKKAVKYRKENNGFISVEEFYEVVGLKPHFIAQISDKLICNSPEIPPTSDTKVGRSLDL